MNDEAEGLFKIIPRDILEELNRKLIERCNLYIDSIDYRGTIDEKGELRLTLTLNIRTVKAKPLFF